MLDGIPEPAAILIHYTVPLLTTGQLPGGMAASRPESIILSKIALQPMISLSRMLSPGSGFDSYEGSRAAGRSSFRTTIIIALYVYYSLPLYLSPSLWTRTGLVTNYKDRIMRFYCLDW